MVAFNAFPASKLDIYIPRVLRHREGGLLSFEQALQEPLMNLYCWETYQELGVELVPNTSEDLVTATIEMLQRIDGSYQTTAEDEALHARFKALTECYESGAMVGRIGAAYLRKYAHLLPAEHSTSQAQVNP